MRKEYTINELAEILGCSRTAIVKKIKDTGDNTGKKRYKERYEVTSYNGQIAILLDDAEIEEEKKLSRGMGKVTNNGYNTVKNDDIIDIEPNVTESKENELINFTERYLERFTTLQETMYNELKQRDSQILLLTTSENAKQQEFLQTKAENKTLKQRNTILTVILSVAVTVAVVFITLFITLKTLPQNGVTKTEQKNEPSQQVVVQPVKKAQRR